MSFSVYPAAGSDVKPAPLISNGKVAKRVVPPGNSTSSYVIGSMPADTFVQVSSSGLRLRAVNSSLLSQAQTVPGQNTSNAVGFVSPSLKYSVLTTPSPTGVNMNFLAADDYVATTIFDATSPFTDTTMPASNGPWVGAIFGGLVIAAGGSGALYTAPLTASLVWTSRTSQFGSDQIRAISYDGTTAVAVGASGKVATSTDGTTWTSRTSGVSAQLNAVVSGGGGKFVAVGSTGTLIYSTDSGATWSTQTSQFGSSDIQHISFGDDRWMAVGSDNKISTSTNGTTWTALTSPFTSVVIQSAIYNPATAVWFAAGRGSTSTFISYSSDSGATWSTPYNVQSNVFGANATFVGSPVYFPNEGLIAFHYSINNSTCYYLFYFTGNDVGTPGFPFTFQSVASSFTGLAATAFDPVTYTTILCGGSGTTMRISNYKGIAAVLFENLLKE
jgi:hypothetical protein